MKNILIIEKQAIRNKKSRYYRCVTTFHKTPQN